MNFYFFTYSCRHRSAQYTDRRVKVMNQVISGIRVIKMYGWEYAFKELVVGIRKWVRWCVENRGVGYLWIDGIRFPGLWHWSDDVTC